ncbi:MAG: ribbon-helix-helix domain-containing protein [bacterium]
MSIVRLNITLPKDLVNQLDAIAGPKKKSSFIAECIRRRIEEIEKEKLANLLQEGYQSARSESLELAKEFEAADLEGWDEY